MKFLPFSNFQLNFREVCGNLQRFLLLEFLAKFISMAMETQNFSEIS